MRGRNDELEVEDVLAGLLEHARPLMLERVRPDSCVPMSVLAVRVLRRFGFAAELMGAEAIVANAKMVALADAGRIDLTERLPEWAIGPVAPRV